MPETAGEHKNGAAYEVDRLPDEELLRNLLRCDSKALVIGPRKRTYTETAAYVDHMRQTERWLEMCAEFGEFARTQGDTEQDAEVAGVFMAVVQLIMDFTGTKLGQVPKSWVKMSLDGNVPQDWITQYFDGEHLAQEGGA